jgi:hypothetical protein
MFSAVRQVLARPASWWSSSKELVHKAADADNEAKDWARHALNHQADAGILNKTEAREAKRALDSDATSDAVKHLGAHVALSVPLRFPFGSFARFLWALTFRLKAEVLALVGRLPNRQLHAARRVHSAGVVVAAGIPGIGTFAYVLAEPIRRNRPLLAGLLDEVLRGLPFGLYRSQHLGVLTRHLKSPASAADAGTGPTTPPHGLILASGLMCVISAVLLAATAMGTFPPAGVSADNWASSLLVLAGVMGCATYWLFWRLPRAEYRQDATLNFFRPMSGVFLIVLGIDGALSISEEAASLVARLPLLTSGVFELATMVVPLGILLSFFVFHSPLMRHAPDSFCLLVIAGALAGLSLALKVLASESEVAAIRDGLGLVIGLAVFSAFAADLQRLRTAPRSERRTASRRGIASPGRC